MGKKIVIGLWTVGIVLFAFRSPFFLPVLLAILPVSILFKEDQAIKNVQALKKKIEEALGEPLVSWQTGQLVGNNYPPVKSDNRTLILAVGEKHFAMLEYDTVTGVTLPVEKVKTNITTQSAVKGRKSKRSGGWRNGLRRG